MRLNAIKIETDELKVLKELVSHPDCRIQNLEMEELEIEDDRTQELMSLIMNLKRLFTFDISNNHIPMVMAEGVLQMMNKYRELEILCVDHCEMPDDIGNLLFGQCMN